MKPEPSPRKLSHALRRDFLKGDASGPLRRRLVMVVMVVCGATWYSAASDTLRDRAAALESAERQHDNVAGALAEQAARSLQATDLILQQAALLDPDAPGATIRMTAVPELLRRHMSGVPQVRNLFLFDSDRHLHLSSANPPTGYLEISDRSYYIAQREADRGLYLSEPFISRSTGDPTFVLSRRLPGNGFHGIVGAAVEISYFRRFYNALELGPGSTVDLLRNDGITLVSRETARIDPTPSPWRPFLYNVANRDAVHLRVDGTPAGASLVSLRRVPGYPVVIAVARSRDAILAEWRHEAWTSAVRTFAITSLAAVLLFAVLRQLRRQERMTAALHRSQKLEALGTLAGGIAHDFNNMLGVVLGYGELAAQQAPAGSSARRYVDNIVVAANRAREMVARILAFSRPGVGARGPLILQDVIGEIASLMRASIVPPATLEIELPTEPVVVAGDPSQLYQVVSNLLANAAQAITGPGTVQITLRRESVVEARECTVGRVLPGSYARIDVRDSGTGIASEDVDKIFDPFWTTKPAGHGTGLGLSLVRGIVLDHGGAIELRTQVGRGTEFQVYLPTTAQAPGVAPPPRELPLGTGQTVLVIDDEEALVRLMEEVLASLGYEPVGCVGGRAGIDAFVTAPQRFDAVLCDVVMPDLGGLAVREEIARIRPDIPVLLVSGYGGAALASHASQAPQASVLRKPLRAAELAQALAAAFRGPPATGDDAYHRGQRAETRGA